MNELMLVIDDWGHKELKDYLLSLNGIQDVKIDDEDKLYIYLKYDEKKITPKMINMEITLFLDIKIPSMYSFDKYPTSKVKTYKITRDDICCEYCLRGAIEDLFDTDGIEKVESNYDEYYYQKSNKSYDKIEIDIEYNPDKISLEDLKKLESNLTL